MDPQRTVGRGRGQRARSPNQARPGFRSPDRSSATTGSARGGTSSGDESVSGSSSSVAKSVRTLEISDPSVGGADTTGPSGAPRGAHRGVRHDDCDYIVTAPSSGKTKHGSKGSPANLRCNYYRIQAAPKWSLYQYRVDYSNEEDSTILRKKLMRAATMSMEFSYTFDGTMLFSAKLLTHQDGSPLEAKDSLELDVPADTVKTVTTPVKLTIRLVSSVKSGHPAYLQVFNLLIRKALFSLELEEMGRNFFDPKDAHKYPNLRLELWPGYITSMRLHQKDILLCVEITHKVVRMDSVLQVINGIESRGRFSSRVDLAAAANLELKDSIVMTSYNNKTYKVEDVDFTQSPSGTFDYKGEQISFAEYFKVKYGLVIKDMKQPLIIVRPSKKDLHRGGNPGPIALVPEFCQPTGLTDSMRSNFQLMKELSKTLHQGPQERSEEIQRFMKRLTGTETIRAEFRLWGLNFLEGLVQLEGRVLPKEIVCFAQGTHPADDKGDFTMAFRSQKMLSAENLTNWGIIVPNRDAGGVDNLVRTMTKVATPLSMTIKAPMKIEKTMDIKFQAYLTAINNIKKDVPNLQLIFIILPNNKAELYNALKKKLAVDDGIPSQCFLAKNVTSKGLMSIATKVVIQINAKLGGEPWTVKLPMKKTMFVGFDVYHGTKGSKSGSVGAMVASISPGFGKYFSTTSMFHSNDELSKTIRADVSKCLHAFRESNGDLPERIILYRDGVGDGQLREVYTVELEQLKEGIKELYVAAGKVVAKLVYIVVTKRVNTRLLLNKGSRFDNPPPGTVVDDTITLPERYDFYLISCAARQGTVSPCSYHVLFDESGMEADRIQLITFKMCHMYYNWSGTIAVPAPCQYAHKLAFLTGMAYRQQAHQRLSTLLHFL